ncbi:uncharacterized protein LOC125498443 [Beta vulgaris subsp. vulgaris]|uniref:uncharacterized protein LOC125498443 n=1 Tax=Beta vulgaris subsp. vulgaris TaxID=3555 RepID=UPI0025494514|nr:uncharacterized protein LOC125498443 [Beta vulgaris subsp. vulgaris]
MPGLPPTTRVSLAGHQHARRSSAVTPALSYSVALSLAPLHRARVCYTRNTTDNLCAPHCRRPPPLLAAVRRSRNPPASLLVVVPALVAEIKEDKGYYKLPPAIKVVRQEFRYRW